MYQISVDGGKTYQDVVSEEIDENGNTVEKWIEIDYYALNKMSHETDEDADKDFTFGIHANPIALKFRRKEEYKNDDDAYKGLKVYKILVNDASVFDENDLGENVLKTGTQKQGEDGNYLSGRYAAYVDQSKNYGTKGYTVGITSGGLNFSDFKIESIKNTKIQMVFYVRGLRCPIKIKGGSYRSTNPAGCSAYVYVSTNTSEGNDSFTTHETIAYVNAGQKKLTLRARVDWTAGDGFQQIGDYDFRYQYQKLDILGQTTSALYGARDAYNVTLDINDIVWTADPEIHVLFAAPASYYFAGKSGGEYLYFSNFVLTAIGNTRV